MTRVLAIDPGNAESAYVITDHDRHPIRFGKTPNHELLRISHLAARGVNPGLVDFDVVAIEMVASYGMAVGADVFETCVWIGRFYEALAPFEPDLVKRQPVKLHHCHSTKAKDSNITQALVDRFAPGQPNKGKGTKNSPGWFYGFAKDVWQAYALAVYVADTHPSTGEKGLPA